MSYRTVCRWMFDSKRCCCVFLLFFFLCFAPSKWYGRIGSYLIDVHSIIFVWRDKNRSENMMKPLNIHRLSKVFRVKSTAVYGFCIFMSMAFCWLSLSAFFRFFPNELARQFSAIGKKFSKLIFFVQWECQDEHNTTFQWDKLKITLSIFIKFTIPSEKINVYNKYINEGKKSMHFLLSK